MGESGRTYTHDDGLLLGILADQIGLAVHAARILMRREQGRCDDEARWSALEHDLKNDLHAVTLSLSLLSMPGLPAEQRGVQVASIARNVRQMSRRLCGPSQDAERS